MSGATRRTGHFGIGFLATSLVALTAFAAEPATAPSEMSPEEMSRQIEDLRQRLTQMEQKQAELIRNQEVNKTRAEVMKDADQRSELFGNAKVGYIDNRFTLGTADGKFLFRPWLHMQIRYSAAYREGGTTVPDDDTQSGFELRRARFGFDGNLFTPNLQYFFNWATYRGNNSGNVTDSTGKTIGTFAHLNGGTPVLEEAWVLYHFQNTPWSIKGGQMHDPLDHEAIMGSKYRARSLSARRYLR